MLQFIARTKSVADKVWQIHAAKSLTVQQCRLTSKTEDASDEARQEYEAMSLTVQWCRVIAKKEDVGDKQAGLSSYNKSDCTTRQVGSSHREYG